MAISEKIIKMVDMDAQKSDTADFEFDFSRFQEPVQNSKRNVVIELIQAVLLGCSFLTFIVLMFVDFRQVEVTLMVAVPLAVAFLIGKFKDKESQKAYDEYADWELERDELE